MMFFLLLVPAYSTQAQSQADRGASTTGTIKFMLSPGLFRRGIVKELGADGIVRLGTSAGDMVPVTEGYYLGLVLGSLPRAQSDIFQGGRLLRVQVTQVLTGGLMLRISPAAVQQLKQGEGMMLIRPTDSTTEQMAQVPDVIELKPGEAKYNGTDDTRFAPTFENLRQIGLALHNYADVNRQFPPAFVLGPDGKPWHSWRVLILPFLRQSQLYDQYKFDEPWDGPNNKRLLDKMPAYYSDPIHGENMERYTHYVAITGDGMAFKGEGASFDGKNIASLKKPSGRSFREITDGTANTLMVGPAGPEHKIPWTKPEDIRVTDDFPPLGKKGGFTSAYEKGHVAPFLRFDGSMLAIGDNINPQLFRTLLTIAGRENVNWDDVPHVAPPRSMQRIPVIYLEKTAHGTTAQVVQEIPESPRRPGVPAPARPPAPPTVPPPG
jgi:hypothetical protein